MATLDFVRWDLSLADVVRAGRGRGQDHESAHSETPAGTLVVAVFVFVIVFSPGTIGSLHHEFVLLTGDEGLAIEVGLNDLAGMSANRAYAYRQRCLQPGG